MCRWFVFPLLAVTAFAQVAGQANANYKTKEGRSQVAQTLANPERDKTQKPAELVDALKLRPGMTVADIGTGIGYMLPHLSRAVGPNGKVIAQDIQTDFLDQSRALAIRDKLTNVQYVLGTERDPKLAMASIDVALVLDVYHHFDYPQEMLSHLRSALKPGGRLVIVDYYKKSRPDHIRLERDDAAREIEATGFELAGTRDHNEEQYILEFMRP